MGKNNRQRRAAKQRARHRPGPASARTAASQPRSQADHERQLDEADRLLSRLTHVAEAATPRGLGDFVEQELVNQTAAGLRLLDELMSARLTYNIARLWEGGWQPLDLVHVARKAGARLVPPVVALIAMQAQASHADQRAPREWLGQLRTVADEVPEVGPAVDTRRDGLLAAALADAGTRLIEVWVDIALLSATLIKLPVLERIVPPPSAWGLRRTVVRRADDGSDRSKLMNRIRGLLAKAEATEYAAEAETFTAKAQDLMSRHAIDEALLHDSDDGGVDVVARRVHLQSPYASTKALLLTVVGTANRTRVIYLESVGMATVVGTPVDVDQVEMLFTSLLIQATRALAEAGAARAGSFDRSATYRRSFLTAYAVRIGERLVEADRAATASYGTELVPVLRRQAEAVDGEFGRLFPHTRTLQGGYLDRRGWEAGRRAADQAVLTSGRITA